MLKLVIIGNVGKDPDVRYTQSNKKVASFNVAHTEGKGDNAVTTWVTCDAWDKTADIVEKYVKKGSQVYVEGLPRLEEWTDKEGKNRTTLKVTVRDLQLLGSRQDSQAAPQAAGPGTQNTSPQTVATTEEDNLPF